MRYCWIEFGVRRNHETRDRKTSIREVELSTVIEQCNAFYATKFEREKSCVLVV